MDRARSFRLPLVIGVLAMVVVVVTLVLNDSESPQVHHDLAAANGQPDDDAQVGATLGAVTADGSVDQRAGATADTREAIQGRAEAGGSELGPLPDDPTRVVSRVEVTGEVALGGPLFDDQVLLSLDVNLTPPGGDPVAGRYADPFRGRLTSSVRIQSDAPQNGAVSRRQVFVRPSSNRSFRVEWTFEHDADWLDPDGESMVFDACVRESEAFEQPWLRTPLVHDPHTGTWRADVGVLAVRRQPPTWTIELVDARGRPAFGDFHLQLNRSGDWRRPLFGASHEFLTSRGRSWLTITLPDAPTEGPEAQVHVDVRGLDRPVRGTLVSRPGGTASDPLRLEVLDLVDFTLEVRGIEDARRRFAAEPDWSLSYSIEPTPQVGRFVETNVLEPRPGGLLRGTARVGRSYLLRVELRTDLYVTERELARFTVGEPHVVVDAALEFVRGARLDELPDEALYDAPGDLGLGHLDAGRLAGRPDGPIFDVGPYPDLWIPADGVDIDRFRADRTLRSLRLVPLF